MLRALILVFVVSFGAALRPCIRNEACGIIETRYADPTTTTLLPPENVTMEGSGEGSGEAEEVEPLMYDHLAYPQDSAFPDQGQEVSNRTDVELCACGGGDSTCTIGDENRTVTLDPFLQLTFCKPPEEMFRHKCKGKRADVRLFGVLDVSGSPPDPLLTVHMERYTETKAYCYCPPGKTFEKVNKIESWSGHKRHAFLYICR